MEYTTKQWLPHVVVVVNDQPSARVVYAKPRSADVRHARAKSRARLSTDEESATAPKATASNQAAKRATRTVPVHSVFRENTEGRLPTRYRVASGSAVAQSRCGRYKTLLVVSVYTACHVAIKPLKFTQMENRRD